jgi:hypothetical protein
MPLPAARSCLPGPTGLGSCTSAALISVLGARCLTWSGPKVTGTRRNACAGAAGHGASTMFIGVGSFKDLTWHRDRESARSRPSALLSGCAAPAIVASCSPAGRCAPRTPTGDGRRWSSGRCPLRPAVPWLTAVGDVRSGPAKRVAAAVGEGPVSVRSPASTSRSLTERISSALTSGRSPMSQTWRSVSAGRRNPLVRPDPGGSPRPGWLPA